MNGCTIPNTPIAVDFWKVRECPQARLYFLTHLHGDHIAGLTSSWNYPIFCSEITGRLLKHKYELKDELIKVMEVGVASIVYLDRDNTQQMTVSALDANHCPGAVMFLFEGYFGRILHTGDFRFKPDMLKVPPLSDLPGKIDTLYLDNTYCSPKCVFPDRDYVTKEIIHIIQSHPNHDVIIGMRSLGKEDLLQEIALQCKTWISVPSIFFNTLSLIEAKNVFKNNCKECRIRIVPFHMISNRFVTRLNETTPTIVIIPTALYVGIDAEPYCNQDSVFVVPYSDHSSYPELQTFVSFLKPCSIIPIVKSKSRGPFGVCLAERSDMSCFNRFINKESKIEICVPASVKLFMTNHRANPVISGKPVRGHGSTARKVRGKRQHERGIIYQSPSKDCSVVLDSDIHTRNIPYTDRNRMTETVNSKGSGVSDLIVIENANSILDREFYIDMTVDEPVKCRNYCDKSVTDITNCKEIINGPEMKECLTKQDFPINAVPHPSCISDRRAKNDTALTEMFVIESQGFVVETKDDLNDNDIVRVFEENLDTVQTSSEMSVENIFADDNSCIQYSDISKELINKGDLNCHEKFKSKTSNGLNAHHEYIQNEDLTQDTHISSSNEVITISDSPTEGKHVFKNINDKNELLVDMFGKSDDSFILGTTSQLSEEDYFDGFVSDLTHSSDEMIIDHESQKNYLGKTNKEKDLYKNVTEKGNVNKTENLPKGNVNKTENLPNLRQGDLCSTIREERKSTSQCLKVVSGYTVCRHVRPYSTGTSKYGTMNAVISNVDDFATADTLSFDLTRFRVIPVSAREKSRRRCRLYKNLLTGICRMSQIL